MLTEYRHDGSFYSLINVWVAGKTVWFPLTRAIPERIRAGYDDALHKSTFTLLYLLDEMISPPTTLQVAWSAVSDMSNMFTYWQRQQDITRPHQTVKDSR